MSTINTHPAAELFPMIDDSELDQLADSITVLSVIFPAEYAAR